MINITREPGIFKNKNIKEYLNKKVKKHYVLCIGSPVYAHHFHFNVKEIIKELPEPGGIWGEVAIPFITFGGVSSGTALFEAAKLLKKSGRIPVLAMKINSEHSMTRFKQITVKINEGLPGKKEESLIEELVNKIAQLKTIEAKKYPDITSDLNYLDFKAKLKARIIFREKIWQKHLYPELSINLEKCKKCGICADNCPVLRIEMTENGPMILKDIICVHCLSCISKCPTEAIESNSDWKIYNKLLKKAKEDRGFIQSNEKPKSAIFG